MHEILPYYEIVITENTLRVTLKKKARIRHQDVCHRFSYTGPTSCKIIRQSVLFYLPGTAAFLALFFAEDTRWFWAYRWAVNFTCQVQTYFSVIRIVLIRASSSNISRNCSKKSWEFFDSWKNAYMLCLHKVFRKLWSDKAKCLLTDRVAVLATATRRFSAFSSLYRRNSASMFV